MINPLSMRPESWQYFLLIPVLYAEIHYRFKYFFSYLKKREPEIIADLPHRLEAGRDLPVLLIIKDADRYPISISGISLLNGTQEIFSNEPDVEVSDPYKDYIFIIPRDRFTPGLNQISVKISYRIGNKNRICVNDNHRGTSHKPFPVYIADDHLPRIGHCYFGEPHCHTNYTSDQVEFGASLAANKEMSKALGLDFFAATDHSYDLDDHPDNYLKNDPDLRKWKFFLEEVKDLNAQNDGFLIIPGEEVTVSNARGNNIHFLVYNHHKFIRGSGDGAEKWFRWRSEHTLTEVLGMIDPGTPAIAAHPFEIPPLLQRIFINRGSWSDADCKARQLQGLQLLNGGRDDTIPTMIQKWTRLLLQGHRLYGLAGNDAHGNFARFRQINFPFFTMREHYYHLFGKWRTGIYLPAGDQFNLSNMLQALSSGNCYMTNGPALLFESKQETGSDLQSDLLQIHCQIRSAKEFGSLRRLHVLRGRYSTGLEKTIVEKNYDDNVYEDNQMITVTTPEDTGYYRCEVYTDCGKMAFSNPVWI